MVVIRHGAVVGVLVLLTVAPAVGAEPWVAANVHGAVLMQVGDQWTEVEAGDTVASGLPVRTLQAGRVELRRRAEVVQLAPDTVMRASDSGSLATIEQFAGQLTLIEARGRSYRLVTPAFTASTGGAVVVSRVEGGAALLSVKRGRVPVWAKGRDVVLTAGQTLSSGAGAAFTVTGEPATAGPAATDTGAATDDESGDADGAARSDNGAGNGGVPGNGGQNGNAGGNGNGASGNAGNGRGNG